ncbi:hypothetical protein [Dyella flagellata]|uniref:MFS transporter n=1 Tax=Dyella flagellata TaxID=1867833 RepID=A0ABQ5XB70_9GAMM|nr:hypothetical protein [Dyella flagellata]GLQ88328.1 hypothetical protein GCM10007898_18970 [Dyella flagellata]
MNTNPFVRPSALVPVLMSLAALAMVLGYIAQFGAAHQADEGAAAHLFQLLMVCQLPIIAYFAIQWLPRMPRRALAVLSTQALAGLAACAPVWYFHL